MVMVPPCSMEEPEPGSTRVIDPAGTESEFSDSTVKLNLSLYCCSTASFAWPTRLSGTLVMPVDTHRVIDEPLVADCPLAGSVRVTRSLATESLSSVLTTEFTSKPASLRILRASS